MNYLDEHRRKLIQKHYTRGALSTIESTSPGLAFENGIEMPLYEFEIQGNTIQKQYQGYNLFDINSNKFTMKNPNTVDNTINYTSNSFAFATNLGGAVDASCYFSAENELNLKPNTTYTSKCTLTLVDNGSLNLGHAGSMACSILCQDNTAFGNVKFYLVNGYAKNSGKYVGTREVYTTFTTPDDLTEYEYIATRVSNLTSVTYENLMIVEGTYTEDTFPDYEPYVGGVLSPSIDYPQPIKNVGDDGIKIVARGANLFDAETVFGEMTTATDSSKKAWVRLLGDWYTTVSSELNGRVLFTNTYQRQGKLTLLVNQRTSVTRESETGLCYAILYTDGSTTALSPKILKTFQYYTITTDENKTVDRIQFSYGGRDVGTYIKEIMISWGDALEYEPYYELAIPVPNKITGRDEDGNEVEFEPKFIGMKHELVVYATDGSGVMNSSVKEFDNRDRMFIDNGRLFYEQNNAVFVITGNETLSPPTVEYGAPYMIDVYQDGGKPKLNTPYGDERDKYAQLMISNVCLSYYQWEAVLRKSGEAYPSPYGVYPLIDMWGGCNEGELNPTPEQCSTTLYIEIPGQNGLETANMLKEMYEAGHPVVVQYVCPTTTYDLTDTEFGQALLNLKLPKNGTIEVMSDIPIDGIKISYYSDEKEDTYSITVHYRDKNGNALRDSKTKSVRRNSKYLVVSPEITGYKPENNTYEGYLTSDTEIIIIYEEDV